MLGFRFDDKVIEFVVKVFGNLLKILENFQIIIVSYNLKEFKKVKMN